MNKTDLWKDYSERTVNSPPKERLVQLLEKFKPAPGYALDVGTGGGRDAKLLLHHDWHVDGLDGNAEALKIAKASCNHNPRLKTLLANFNEISFRPSSYDLLNAGYSLPFCANEKFASFWQNLVASIKPGGLVSCDLFGDKDEWNKEPRSDMTFLNKAECESLFQGFEILQWTEEEKEAPTAMGVPKYWHVFTCNARKK